MITQEIDKILNFSEGNVFVYDSICKDIMKNSDGGGLMPFIGRGITEYAFRNNESFIENVLEQINALTEEQRNAIQKQEESGGFVEALDELINYLGGNYGEDIINRCLEDFYSDKKIDKFALENQAISLVPLLNCGDSVTVNFDRVLEYAYKLAGIDPIIATPSDHNIINNKIRNGYLCDNALLVKIHGNIKSDAKERIITKAAFENKYNNGGEFVKSLTKWIQKYKLLFIGVDLLKDKYLQKILKRTRGEGIKHYAIIGCKDDEEMKASLKNELDKLNITPIIYDINRPISIEIILHKMLVDTKNEKALKKRGELYYTYSEHDLVGREIELEKLEEFLNVKTKYEQDFSWWMIWSKDVSGKSKLSYDFARMHDSEWDWYMLSPGQIDEFIERQVKIEKKNRNLLVIFDDFDCYGGEITQILNFVKRMNRYCQKIRFLFIVRDYRTTGIYKTLSKKEINDRNWVMLVQSAYSGVREICQLSVNDIKEICYQYIWYRKQNLDLKDLEEKELQVIDNKLQQYIENHMSTDKSILILCSLEKAIRLVRKYILGIDVDDSDESILNKVMRYVLTDGEGNLNNQNVNIFEIERRKDYIKEQANKLMEKYDKEKAYNKEFYSTAYEVDSFIFESEKE